MTTKILMIHGRNQASDEQTASDPDKLAVYVDSKKRQFLAGLAKGLVLANCPPVSASNVIFPFYGNIFKDAITNYEDGGGTPPQLEAATPDAAVEASLGGEPEDIRALSRLQAGLLQDLTSHLGFDVAREAVYQGSAAEELGPSSVLGIPFITAALQFLSRKTGIPGAIIRRHLADVAYYIGLPDMRNTVLEVVRNEIEAYTGPDDDLVVVSHSLGSIVAYDLLADPNNSLGQRNVKLLVTAGSPLGLGLVKANVLGKVDGEPAAVPSTLPDTRGSWINAYDALDIVALVHPLAPEFTEHADGQIVDERTFNPSNPHAIIDYLADPDIAAPISRKLTAG